MYIKCNIALVCLKRVLQSNHNTGELTPPLLPKGSARTLLKGAPFCRIDMLLVIRLLMNNIIS